LRNILAKCDIVQLLGVHQIQPEMEQLLSGSMDDDTQESNGKLSFSVYYNSSSRKVWNQCWSWFCTDRKEYNAPAPPFIYLIQVTFGLEEHTIGLLSQVRFYADLYWRFMW